MPDDGRTGEEEKIILNGGSAGVLLNCSASLLEETCSTIYSFTEHDHFDANKSTELVEAANKLEEMAFDFQRSVFKFQKKVLEAVGFSGPFPKTMQ